MLWGSRNLSLSGYLVLPQDSPGSEKAQFFVEAKGTNDGELLALVAEQYFSVTTDAIRRHDPNHLNLGLRGANLAAAEAVGLQPLSFKAFRKVMAAADRHVDVIDWHGYLDPRTASTLIEDILCPDLARSTRTANQAVEAAHRDPGARH